MTEYQKTYIELKKQFSATDGGPDSVRALYAFKEGLEQSEDKQVKEVLVDVYDLLDFKKDAYELLCQIGNRSDKKTLKRLGVLKDYAENWGNHYAIPKPKTPEEKQKEKERQARLGLPAFRYHPNPLETGAFEESPDGVGTLISAGAAAGSSGSAFEFCNRGLIRFQETCALCTTLKSFAALDDLVASFV